MSWSMRIGLSLITLSLAGFILMAANPKAESATGPDGRGYVLAISHGPGLSLANSNTPLESTRKIEAYAQTARALACEVVMKIGSIEIGTRCAYGSRAGIPQTTGSIAPIKR